MAEGTLAVYVQRDTYNDDPEFAVEQALNSARRDANSVDKVLTSEVPHIQLNGTFEWDNDVWDLEHNGLVVLLFTTQDNASLVGVTTHTGTWRIENAVPASE